MHGVSEYTAALIMTIVTLVAGTVIFLYSYHVINVYTDTFSSRALGSGESFSVAILASYIRGNQLIVIGSTGASSATLRAIYVNETLRTCALYYNYTSYLVTGSEAVVIPYRTAFVVICNLPVTSSNAVVKIVFDEGDVVAKAGRII